MSIKNRTIISNLVLLLLPILLVLAFTSTFINFQLIPLPALVFVIIAIASVILLNIFVTIYTIISFTEPLKKLLFATKEIRKGNLDYVVDYDGRDEFKEVFDEFNRMRIVLKRTLEEKELFAEEKRNMTSSIVHDLKTPIATVLGYSQGLIDDIPKTPEKRIFYIKTIHEKTQHIDKLVDNLFLISKAEQKILESKITMIKIEELREILKGFISDLSEEKIETSIIENVNSYDEFIKLDKTQIKRVIQNILENSIKYKSEEDLRINFELRENDDNIIIKIEDNGIGIKKEEEDKIFERFYRSDEARTYNGGTGMGLTTSKVIIENIGGKIWARANKNGGLSVYISFKKE